MKLTKTDAYSVKEGDNMRVKTFMSGNGKPYTVTFWDSCREFKINDMELVNWHTFTEGDALYGFNPEPIGSVVKIIGNKILIA